MPLPEIKWTDLGTGPDGITAAELTQRVLDRVTVETLKLAEKAAVDFGKNAAGNLTKGASEALQKAPAPAPARSTKLPRASAICSTRRNDRAWSAEHCPNLF